MHMPIGGYSKIYDDSTSLTMFGLNVVLMSILNEIFSKGMRNRMGEHCYQNHEVSFVNGVSF